MVSKIGKNSLNVNSGFYQTKFDNEINNPSEKMFENPVSVCEKILKNPFSFAV